MEVWVGYLETFVCVGLNLPYETCTEENPPLVRKAVVKGESDLQVPLRQSVWPPTELIQNAMIGGKKPSASVPRSPLKDDGYIKVDNRSKTLTREYFVPMTSGRRGRG